MTENNKQIWILEGYALFAKGGLNELKVEVMARQVKKSKSSFYHYFADLELFTELLLEYHIERAKIIAEKERLCKNVVPDLLHLLVEYKQDLLFNRQLRINRNNKAFELCFEKTTATVAEAIVGIWAEMLGLTDNINLANIVLNLSLENFYLQITEQTMTYDWLLKFTNDLQIMVKEFKKNELKKPSIVR